MARWAPEKKDTMEALASEILHNYGHGRAIVAVDGRRASGMHQFSEDLATALQGDSRAVFHASIDDFQRPRSERERGWYTDGYDHSLLRRVLIDPFRTAGSTGFALKGFDAERNEPVYQPKWKSAGLDAVLIVRAQSLDNASSEYLAVGSTPSTGGIMQHGILSMASSPEAYTMIDVYDDEDDD